MTTTRPRSVGRHSREVSLVAVGPLDWLVIAAGVLVLLLSFGPFYTYSLELVTASHSDSTDAWSATFSSIATLLAVVASVLAAAAVMVPALRGSSALRLSVFTGYLVALICLVAAFFVDPAVDHSSYIVTFAQQHGHGICYWLSLLVVAFGTTLSVVQLRSRASSTT